MGWNPRKIITNLTKEEFKEWCIENKENLQYYIDSLDDTTYGQFEKWIISQYDLRTWNTLIDSMGNPGCKRPGASLSYNHLVGKPKFKTVKDADYYNLQDRLIFGGGTSVTVGPITRELDEFGKYTYTIRWDIDETQLAERFQPALKLTEGYAANKVLVTDADSKIKWADKEAVGVTKTYVDEMDQGVLATATSKVNEEKNRAETAEQALEDYCDNLDATKAAQTDLEAEVTRAEGVETTLDNAIKTKIDLLGSVPGHTDLPYNLPYFFETTGDANKVTVTAKTISLDNKKTQGTYSLDVNSATTTKAGLMSATDKTKLDSIDTGTLATKTEVQAEKTRAEAAETTINTRISDLPDGVTIKWDAATEHLEAQIPVAMRFKGSKDYVSEVLALTGMVEGDVWYAQKDDRTTPQATAPVVNALICYNGTQWVYAGSTDIDVSTLQEKITTTNKLSSDLVDDAAATNKFVTDTDKTNWNGKLDATKCTYQTTAPTAAKTDGGVHIVYLETEPTTKYNGYIYFIK